MSEMTCEVCGTKVTSWSARYGQFDTIFCKKCFNTDNAKKIIEEKSKLIKKEEIKNIETNKSNKDDISTSTDNKFNTLLGIGKFIAGYGWLIVILGIIALVFGISKIDEPIGVMTIIGGFNSTVIGIFLVAFGQIIECFVAIENNTRETNNLMGSSSDRVG